MGLLHLDLRFNKLTSELPIVQKKLIETYYGPTDVEAPYLEEPLYLTQKPEDKKTIFYANIQWHKVCND